MVRRTRELKPSTELTWAVSRTYSRLECFTVSCEAKLSPDARCTRSALDEAGRARIAADLVRLMRERQVHADAGLDLAELSRLSGWPPGYISQALNLHLKQNFFEFVGKFRLEAARRCLADPAERRTILEIAMACGFGSKSTFNAVFRRSTGLTPSEFRRRHAVERPDVEA